MVKEFMVVDIAQVRANPHNIREDLGDLDRLAGEVKTMGILQPLLVYPHPELEGDYIIKDGHRRHAAAVRAGLSVVPVLVEEVSARGVLDDLETMLTTGRNHRSLNKLEEAKGFQMLLDLGLNESTIGKRFKQPKSEVVTKARVMKAPEKVQDAYGRGRIDLLQLKKLTDLQASGQAEVLERALEARDFDTDGGYVINADRIIAQAETAHQAAEVTERLLALGAKQVPAEKAYQLESVPDEPPMTEEEHVAAGHVFSMSRWSDEPNWYVERSKGKAEELSAEAKAEQSRIRELSAGLLTAFKLRRQFLVRLVQDTGAGVSQDADLELLLGVVWHQIGKLDDVVLAEITGIDPPENKDDWTANNAWRDRVRAVFAKMSWKQLARAAAWGESNDTDKRLRKAPAFARGEYNWSNHRTWLTTVQRLFGYRLDQAERDTVAFYEAKGGNYHYKEFPGANRDVSEDLEVLN